MKGIVDMIHKTWNEVDQRKDMGMTLDIDWDSFKMLEDQNCLHMYTFEDKGYAVFMLVPDLHRKGQIQAVSNVVYIEKEYRGEFNSLLELIKVDLRDQGADFLSMVVKAREEDELYGMRLFEKTYQEKL